MVVGPAILEFRADDPLAHPVIAALYHAASPAPEGTAATLHYRLERSKGGWIGIAPTRPPFGPARLEDVFAFLEWRATEDILTSRNAVFLHAAGVRIHGASVLIVGSSGAGKSTLAAHLFARGHRIWGDDLVCFASVERRFSATPRSFKLDSKSLKSLYLLEVLVSEAAQGTLLAPDVAYVSPAAFRRQWQAPEAPADVVVLLDQGTQAGPPRVERMSEGSAAVAAARMLMGAGAVGTHEEQTGSMAAVVEAMSEARAYRVAGTPPAAVADALERELAA